MNYFITIKQYLGKIFHLIYLKYYTLHISYFTIVLYSTEVPLQNFSM